ncbi:hypothetical protein ACV3V0_08035 [Clostridium perfringens]
MRLYNIILKFGESISFNEKNLDLGEYATLTLFSGDSNSLANIKVDYKINSFSVKNNLVIASIEVDNHVYEIFTSNNPIVKSQWVTCEFKDILINGVKYKGDLTILREYNVDVRLSGVDGISSKSLASYDLGKYVHFNTSDNKLISALITAVYPLGKGLLEISCLVSQETYYDFCYENNDFKNWIDYSLDKCLYNGVDFLDEYLCG